MSLALRWGEEDDENGGFVYIDAVTAYTQNNKGQVTKHPIDSGGNITDHFIRDNPTFMVSGVITGVDISTGTYNIQDLEGNSPFNSSEAPNSVSVNSTDLSVLKKFIPDSLGQFLQDTTPTVQMDDPRSDLLEQIRDALVEIMSGVIYNEKTSQFDSNIQLVKLYEYDQTLLRKVINNLVMTNIAFKEDPNSGYALYCDMNFEQVTFSYLKKTQIPKDVVSSLKKKSSATSSKGKQDSTVKDTSDGALDAPKDTDPLRQALED